MSDLPTTASTGDEPFNYWAWYNSEGNTIRLYNEAHGVILVNSEMGPYLAVARETLDAASPVASPYPDYFANRTFDKFALSVYGVQREKAEKALQIATRYAENVDEIIEAYNGGGLYFYSREKGTGKTFLSTILGNELSRRGKRVRWYGVTNLLQDIKASYDRESGTSSAAIIGTCREVEILILDDIGVEKQSAWVNETMYSILDYRLTHSKPTIFTSNVKPGELAYDARVTDRISRMAELIEMPEINVRQRLNQKSKLGAFLGK